MTDRPQQITAYPQRPVEQPPPVSDSSVEHYLREFAAFAASLADEPARVASLRREAIARFGELGFPTMKNEDWHFTSVAPISARSFRMPVPGAGPAVTQSELDGFEFGHPEWPTLTFVNGRLNPGLSTASSLPSGATLKSLRAAIDAGEDVVERWLGRITDHRSAAFTALNTAFFADGAVLHVGRNVVLDAPIHLVFVSVGSDTAAHPRNLVVLEQGAAAAVVETYLSFGDDVSLTNAVTEIRIGDGARLDHVKVQRESAASYHVGTSDARQGRDSAYHSFSYATGADLSRTNIYTVLDGEGGHATLHGLYMVEGTQHVDHQTRIEHAQPNCTSYEVYKGVLDGRSHGVFNGKVYVRPEAQKTDGKQSNNNLLLSPNARVDTKPQLEIFADDVKCTHGATIGRLDENALFYFRSRGIPEQRARILLTYAFAAEVIEEIELEPVRTELERLVLARVGESPTELPAA
ncbi:MAG TPA: Fe-S cluster assembly protein SufD [Gemmatimonadaceae bacterium]|nr:Fe-S cluster assembly protein SufD [Gemmatimonadaceae bacterium]